eukprot:scaffold3625_cov372-Prasinococcus_capsulatus_cf.AAC.4
MGATTNWLCGAQLGTPFRIRGVNAGEVKKIVPGLDSVQVEVEVMDQNVLIPRNSLIEANQHGLIAETQIDVMPESPFPNPKAGACCIYATAVKRIPMRACVGEPLVS